MKTIVNKNTGEVLFATIVEVELKENEMAIDSLLNVSMIKPFYNFETKVFYETATEEEIAQVNKALVPDEVPLWAMRNVLKKRNLFDAIIGAVNRLPEPLKTDALDFLEYGNFIERKSNAVLLIQQFTEKSNDEVDELFIEANNIKL